MVKLSYKVGDKVFAKVKGYPPWPAQVVGDTGKKKYNVLFYGTQETGTIKAEDLSYYLKYKENYIHKYTKRAGYEDAVKEIEEAIKKDGGDGNDGSVADESIQDVDMSDTSSISSVSEKKAPKRKSVSVSEETVKKTPVKGRRKSATSESKDENIAEPPTKKQRRKFSAASKEEEEVLENDKSTDNGTIKDATEPTDKEESDIVESEAEPKSLNKDKLTKNAEETTSASETERAEAEAKQIEQDSLKTKTTGRDTKEPEFVEIKDNDNVMEMEDEHADADNTPVKVDIVTEQSLNNLIAYAEHVRKNLELYNGKPVEHRNDSKDEVVAVKLPSGIICGVKLHKVWPLSHANEHDRALYDEKVAKLALEVKELLASGKKSVEEVEAEVIPNIRMTMEDIKEVIYARDIESKRKRMNRLKREADLVTWDSKIKTNLGLDKALPDAALAALKEFGQLEKDVDALMFMKHPHVLDTIRRLRKYVGNLKEWDMTDEEISTFTQKAEKIRNAAEKIYNKIKNIIEVKEEKGTFWDSFKEFVGNFRTKCRDMTESEILFLCAEPDSRQAFFDKLEEIIEPEGTNINPTNTSEAVLKDTSVQGWSEKK